MDEIFNSLESGEAAIGAYYAGDYFTMAEAQAGERGPAVLLPRTHQLLH